MRCSGGDRSSLGFWGGRAHFSMRAILPRADFIERVSGSPAYTPDTNGSMQRRKTSSPRIRLTHSRIVSSSFAGGGG